MRSYTRTIAAFLHISHATAVWLLTDDELHELTREAIWS